MSDEGNGAIGEIETKEIFLSIGAENTIPIQKHVMIIYLVFTKNTATLEKTC